MNQQSLYQQLTRYEWVMHAGTRKNTIGFEDDGLLSGIPVFEQENQWVLHDCTLQILDKNQHTVHRLQLQQDDPLTFTGKTTIADSTFDVAVIRTDVLRNNSHYREIANDRIIIESRLGVSRDFLLVTFNSLGSPFTGIDNDWEMYHLPNQLSTDYIRFSATKTPRTWYTDKIDRVYPMLKSAVQIGYKNIAFIGSSAGGYACILFSELLAEEFPGLNLHTFTINPTILVGKRHYQEMISFEMPVRAGLPLSPLTRSDGKEVDLDILLRNSAAKNVTHEIHFDSKNPFEAFQIEKIGNGKNIRLVPTELGLGHIESTIRIYESGTIQGTIRRLLPPMFP